MHPDHDDVGTVACTFVVTNLKTLARATNPSAASPRQTSVFSRRPR
jgi:hypothetical protein